MRIRDGELGVSPTDLNNFLACRHLSALDLARSRGELSLRTPSRPGADLIAAKGRAHEQAYLATLGDVAAVAEDAPYGVRVERTAALMRDGAQAIYQAAFADGGWSGVADFVVRIEEPSALGAWSYQAVDAKLAAHPKPYFVLQLAFYTEQIARVQGRMPTRMHVVLGAEELRSFRYGDFSAYVRRVRERFLAFVGDGEAPPYPYPVAHCEYCDWWAHCRDKRRADDHLSLVASLSRGQSIRLEDAGVPTVRALARSPSDLRVPRIGSRTLADLQLQARLQIESRDTGEPRRQLLPLEDGRGFFRLPASSGGDVFFDIEGDPWWGQDGLEYLFGSLDRDGYRRLWAHDEDEERAALAAWVDEVSARLTADPAMHVYHYNHYEPTALKRLMSKYGTRENEVDELLRRGVFVDLYAIVRQALRVGEESYSLKRIERFHPMERDADVTEAGGSILAYQEYLESGDEAKLDAITAYNADDCRSTRGLRDWLLELRDEAAATFDAVLPNRETIPARAPSEAALARAEQRERLRAGLLAGAPDAERRLLAELVEYHRREQKPQWWEYFDRLTRAPQELADEDGEAIGALNLAEDVPRRQERQSYVYPLRFPPQQHKIRPGTALDPEGERAVNVVEVDDAAGLVWISRAMRADGQRLPRAIVPGRPYDTDVQHQALALLAERVIADGTQRTGRLDASCELLRAAPPRFAGPADTLNDEVAALDASVLFIQGPPGAGKTYTGARLIVDLVRRGRRAGVAATSHKAIHNLLREVEAVAQEERVRLRGLKKSSGGNEESRYEGPCFASSDDASQFEHPDPELQVLAGTAWLWARAGMEAAVDVLFVDEAGQVALADALAMAQAASSVVLLGDPQQLGQVFQGTHPEGAGASVLEHLLGEDATIPPDRGVFLDRTWRMHPDVCRFVSETMYDDRLRAVERCAQRRIDARGLSGTGCRWLAVPHEGNRQTSPEEAAAIGAEIERLLDGGTVTDYDGEVRPLTWDDVLVVAPYNAQVRELRRALGDAARIGTVDKFQGQEAPVVFFSMTSSSAEDVPRGMEFLFSRNRLNVAVSRAQCLAAVACAPQLLETRCNSVDQMRLVNALCRFVELAE
ncbi:MAG TPA: TM0106 family RecB-like putative nuclease [Solirubrobacteraceae bacterium]|nr:TM0106 family RecB-like putative nuclease [Solirubrobacteraceae bacterium]